MLLLVAFLGFGVAVGMAAKGSRSVRPRAREVVIAQAPIGAGSTGATSTPATVDPPAVEPEATPGASAEAEAETESAVAETSPSAPTPATKSSTGKANGGASGGGSSGGGGAGSTGAGQGSSGSRGGEEKGAPAGSSKKLPAVNGKLAVAGFCWGGGQSFRFATNRHDLSAAFVFYGPPPQNPSAATAPVYGFYAGNDARISATVPDTTVAMKAAGKKYDPVIYDGAGHGFMRAGEDPTRTTDNDANIKARDAAWERWKVLLKGL